MKFAQYLRDTQTPEWKKAYIDYRGLKKRITAIRKAQHGLSFHASTDSPGDPPSPPDAPQPSDVDSEEFERSVDLALERVTSGGKESGRGDAPSESGNPKSIASRGRRSIGMSSFKPTRGKSFSSMISNAASTGSPRLDGHPFAALPLHELLTQLSPHEVSFFTLLDAQLDKVESFYLAREKEMLARGRTLQFQLDELGDHRKLFLEAHTQEPWSVAILATIRNMVGLYPPLKIPKKWHIINKTDTKISAESDLLQAKPNDAVAEAARSTSTSALRFLPTIRSIGKRKDSEQMNLGDNTHEDEVLGDDDDPRVTNLSMSADPDSYLYAKRRLKKAVIEHYRGLEMLHNYRVLNITGFRKALKKFEKVTKIPVQHQYMTEKVDKSAFASDKAVHHMMTQMEDMYAKAFVRGDKKKALKRLRGGGISKNHHFSTFRSGVLLGLAIPALVNGIVKVFQSHTREAIPRWDVLLYIYGLILVPVLFTLLAGLNLVVWANSRINYVFIFEIDVLTQLDHREYFETPSILLAALCYAFWLSFSDIGPPVFSPTTWPLIWLLFAFVTIFNPFPIMFRSSRYWLIKHVAELFISGTKHVEFTDFWMGDQFCSLVFTLSNIYFFVCIYVDNFSPNWENCSVTSKDWPFAFVGAALPLFIRLVQSIKRYNDSKLITHLINGGKYGSGIVNYLFFFMWRHHQVNHGSIFTLYLLTSINYSLYALSWDLLMDWSLLRLHSPHVLLRAELVYNNYVPLYYFAIVSNILIRFIWIIYIPTAGPSMMLRSFIAGLLEMLRRWQWNFIRLENEHLGNMDQYRVTREVPLPYAVDERRRDYDQDDDDDDHHLKLKR